MAPAFMIAATLRDTGDAGFPIGRGYAHRGPVPPSRNNKGPIRIPGRAWRGEGG